MIKDDNPKNTCPVINCDPSSGIKQSPVCGLQCYYNSFSLRVHKDIILMQFLPKSETIKDSDGFR